MVFRMSLYKKVLFCIVIVGIASCNSLVQIEKVNINNQTNGYQLSTSDFYLHRAEIGDSIMFEINAGRLKKHLENNQAVWLHFVYSKMCADAELYDCETYKELNKKYRDKISYVMVSEIAHSQLAQELKMGCELLGYHTYVADKNRIHNEVRTLRKLKKEVFNLENNDTLLNQINYILINNKVVYATDQTLDKEKMELIFGSIVHSR